MPPRLQAFQGRAAKEQARQKREREQKLRQAKFENEINALNEQKLEKNLQSALSARSHQSRQRSQSVSHQNSKRSQKDSSKAEISQRDVQSRRSELSNENFEEELKISNFLTLQPRRQTEHVKSKSKILKEHFLDEEIKSEPKANAIKGLAGLLVIGMEQTKPGKEVDEGGKKTNNTLIQQQQLHQIKGNSPSSKNKESSVELEEIAVRDKIIKRVPKSLFCCSHKNPVRKLAAYVSEDRVFKTLIMILIFANCCCMAGRDYIDKDDKTQRNIILNYVDNAFSAVFIIEAILKIITSGFVFGKDTYLRDYWNLMDFAIVLAAILDFIMNSFHLDSAALSALKTIRVLRVLRPLKAVKTMPSLRQQVTTLLKSLKQLASVMIFLLAIFVIFGVMGLQLFQQSVHYSCRLTEKPAEGATVWPKATQYPGICDAEGDNSWDSYKGKKCPEGTFCGSPLDYGLEPDADILNDVNYNYGFSIFSDIGDSIFAVFQIISMDGWTPIMYNLSDHESIWVPSFFIVTLVFLGSFFLVQLMLAVIMMSYEKSSFEVEDSKNAQLEKEKIEQEEHIAKIPSMQEFSELNNLLNKRERNIMSALGQKLRNHIQEKIQIDRNTLPVNKHEENESESKKEGTPVQEFPLCKNWIDHSDKGEDNIAENLDIKYIDNQSRKPLPHVPSSSPLSKIGNSIFPPIAGANKNKGISIFPPIAEAKHSPGISIFSSISEADSSHRRSGAGSNVKDLAPKQHSVKRHTVEEVSSKKSNSERNISVEDQIISEEDKEDQKIEKIVERNLARLASHQASLVNQDQSQTMTSGNTMMKRISFAMFSKVQSKSKELQQLEKLKSITQQSASLFTLAGARTSIDGIFSRSIAAVNLSNLQDKYEASKQIKLQSNLMISKIGEALKKRYLIAKDQKSYGLKSEGTTISLIRSSIKKAGEKYKFGANAGNNVEIKKSQNPLAAILAKLKADKDKKQCEKNSELLREDGEIDSQIQKQLNKGSLQPDCAIKLIMDIKSQTEMKFAEKDITAKNSNHLSSMLLEKHEVETLFDDINSAVDRNYCVERAKNNFVYSMCLLITQSKTFTFFVSICIIFNTIVLGLDGYPSEVEVMIFIEQINLFFFLIFVFEMILKMLGLGFKMYFKDTANLFDFVVVAVSTVDFLSLIISSDEMGKTGSKAFQVIRVFRLLRVFKLAKVWPEFAYILETAAKTLKKILPFSLLLLIFIFSFSILGMELFSATVSFDENDVPLLDDYKDGVDNIKGTLPDSTFNNFLEAFLTVFIVLTNDGWTTIYFNHARALRANDKSIMTPLIFFVSLLVIGQHILFQLFLAILLQEFDERSLLQEADDKKKEQENTGKISIGNRIKLRLQKFCCDCCCQKNEDQSDNAEEKDENSKEGDVQNKASIEKQGLNQTDAHLISERLEIEGQNSYKIAGVDDQQGGGGDSVSEEKEEKKLKKPVKTIQYGGNRSLFIFREDNKFRKWLKNLEESKYFQNTIIALIVLTSISLAIENPLNDPNSTQSYVLNIIDIVSTCIFTVEVFIKVISRGLIFNGKHSYFRYHYLWNALDFSVVIISILSVSLSSDGSSLSILKVLRMGRLLRPMKLLSKNEGLRVSIEALSKSVVPIIRLLMICILFYVIFAIMGTTLFKGDFQECNTSAIKGLTSSQIREIITDKLSCLNYGGEWVTYYKNFDSFSSAMMQAIVMSQAADWSEFMNRAERAKGPEQQPGTEKSYQKSLYFITYIIFGAFFMTNLFVGVVISSYNREKDRLGNNFLLSMEQKRYLETKLLVVQASPIRKNLRPENRFRGAMFCISESKAFDIFINICIGANAIIMSIKNVGLDDEKQVVLQICNTIFTVIFFLEMVIRLCAYGRNYFRDYWYLFDFTIVIGSCTLLVIQSTLGSNSLNSVVTSARLLRIGRLLRLLRQLKQLQDIFQTFISTLQHLLNVGSIMFLIIYVYAIIGVNLFAEVKPSWPMHRFLGFTGFYKSYITLIRVLTGEGWQELMVALSKTTQIDNQCIQNPSYEDFVKANFEPQGCGNPIAAQIYILSFIFIVGMIFLNLFIAIILQGYYQTTEISKQEINQRIIDHYKETWAEFDPEATGFMESSKFGDFMLKLGLPLGWDESFRGKKKKQELFFRLISKNVKTYEDHKLIEFFILDALTLYYIIKTEVEAEMQDSGIKLVSDDDEDNENSGSQEDTNKNIKISKQESNYEPSSSNQDSGSDENGAKKEEANRGISMKQLKCSRASSPTTEEEKEKVSSVSRQVQKRKSFGQKDFSSHFLSKMDHYQQIERIGEADLVKQVANKKKNAMRKVVKIYRMSSYISDAGKFANLMVQDRQQLAEISSASSVVSEKEQQEANTEQTKVEQIPAQREKEQHISFQTKQIPFTPTITSTIQKLAKQKISGLPLATSQNSPQTFQGDQVASKSTFLSIENAKNVSLTKQQDKSPNQKRTQKNFYDQNTRRNYIQRQRLSMSPKNERPRHFELSMPAYYKSQRDLTPDSTKLIGSGRHKSK